MTSLELKAYEVLKTKFSATEATSLIEFVDKQTLKSIDQKMAIYSTREDMHDLELTLLEKIQAMHRSIYLVGVIQFLAIVASVLAIVSFVLK